MTAFSKALHIEKGGYSGVPLDPVTGLPAIKGWDRLREKPMSAGKVLWLCSKFPRLGLAVAGGFNGLIPIDVDTDDPEIIAAVASILPKANVARRGSKGFLAFYYDPTGKIGGRKYVPPGGKPLVEVLGTGVASIPPTVHRKTGQVYRWLTERTLFNTRVTELVVITPEHLARLEQALARWCPPRPVFVPKARPAGAPVVTDKRMHRFAETVLRNEVTRLAALRSGRNWGVFSAACKLGKFVHNDVLGHDEVVNALMKACELNGYSGQDGDGAVQALRSINSGLDKSANDELPVLLDKPFSRARTYARESLVSV
jgi:hypothetical protein